VSKKIPTHAPLPDPLPAGERETHAPLPNPLPAGERETHAPLPNPLPAGEGETHAPLPSPLSGGGRENHSPAWTWLGFRLVDSGEGTAVVEMTPTADMANHSGYVHGGIISALADTAMGRAMRTIKPGVTRAVSFDLKLTFIGLAKIGQDLRAAGSVIHAGRRTVVTECRVEDKDGRLVATASGTFAVTREKE
jgi:uncharacterized protein (TIGR00369 family)